MYKTLSNLYVYRYGFVWMVLIMFVCVCVPSVSMAQQSTEKVASSKDSSSTPPKTRLRSEPIEVPAKPYLKNSRKIFGLNAQYRPLEDIENDFEDMGGVIMDHATGRLWQKAGAAGFVTYEEAKAYIEELNQQQFAGYNDWRLPTIPELMSLVEKEKQDNGMYINPLFDTTQFWCWSADLSLPKAAWLVDFKHGTVNAVLLTYYNYVRAVRF